MLDIELATQTSRVLNFISLETAKGGAVILDIDIPSHLDAIALLAFDEEYHVEHLPNHREKVTRTDRPIKYTITAEREPKL